MKENMGDKMPLGKLICIEGTDGSGKATQTKLLIERLKKEKINADFMSFPNYRTPTGRIIGECYLGKDLGQIHPCSWFGDANDVDPKIASLYYAADRVAAIPKIKKTLESGTHLILDRYVDSNKAHQGGKLKDIERTNIINLIEKLEYGLLEIPRPDKTIFLYMPYQVGIELKKDTKETADSHEASPEHLKNAEETYLELAGIERWIQINCAPDNTINSLRTKKDIHKEVYQKVREIIN